MSAWDTMHLLGKCRALCIVGRAFARIVNVKELLANEAISSYILQQIGDVSTVPVLSVRQTVDMIGKPLEILHLY